MRFPKLSKIYTIFCLSFSLFLILSAIDLNLDPTKRLFQLQLIKVAFEDSADAYKSSKVSLIKAYMCLGIQEWTT